MNHVTVKKEGEVYQVHGGVIHPFTMELLGARYIMPGWHKLRDPEATPDLKDIEFHPYQANVSHTPSKAMGHEVHKVKSSTGDTFYEVNMSPSGSLQCTCMGYGYRRRCRHTALVESRIK